MDNPQLIKQYRSLLSDIDLALVNRRRATETAYAGLSGLFLASAPTTLHQAQHRIMVVGRETRAWNVLKAEESFSNIDEYIEKALFKQQGFMAKHLVKPKGQGCSFFNFLRAISARSGNEGLIWANLFCFSWKRSSPMRTTLFPIIKELSEQLLKLQIQALKPDIIIFANGTSTAAIRQQYFPHKGPESVCSESKHFVMQGIAKKQLWSFKLDNKYQCFRIQHPSSRSRDARAARDYLLGLLPHAECKYTNDPLRERFPTEMLNRK